MSSESSSPSNQESSENKIHSADSATDHNSNFFSTYWENSRNPLFSYLISIPLLLIYELLVYLTQPDTQHAVRISADVWIKSLYFYLGYNTVSVTLLIVAVFGIFLFISQRRQGTRVNSRHLGLMLLEALGWSIVLALLISGLTSQILSLQVQSANTASLSLIQEFTLSLGAGLYEELFFRLFLVWGCFQILKRIFTTTWLSYVAAALVSAFLFSMAHFTGSMGEMFTLNAFLFRFLFGLALNALFVLRGFGITAWTHAFYDLLVLFVFT